MKKPHIAFVYDRVNKFGGAERVLTALHEIWPEAPLYTAVYDPKKAGWAQAMQVHPSFLQYMPFAKNHHEWFAWATPMAFETFSFDPYDIVISVTSAEAKNIITKPGTLHICYCLTPTRYLWSGKADYSARTHIGLPAGLTRAVLNASINTLRTWDLTASSRPDTYIAISHRVADRIRTFYNRDVHSVIYPPVWIDNFIRNSKSVKPDGKESFHLVVSRLVGYKRIDILVDAFNALGWPLVIVGDGAERSRLEKRAKQNIRFTGWVSDDELSAYYRACSAFVFAGEEDFGIAAVEAQASGKPVIAYEKSGIAEIIQPGVTGILFGEQTVQSLLDALKSAEGQWYDSQLCISQSKQFSVDHFKRDMKLEVQTLYNTFI